MFSIHQIEFFSLFSPLRNLEPGIWHGNSNTGVQQREELVFVRQFYNCRDHAVCLCSVKNIYKVTHFLQTKNITQFVSVCVFWKVTGVTKIPMPYFSLITSEPTSELVRVFCLLGFYLYCYLCLRWVYVTEFSCA